MQNPMHSPSSSNGEFGNKLVTGSSILLGTLMFGTEIWRKYFRNEPSSVALTITPSIETPSPSIEIPSPSTRIPGILCPSLVVISCHSDSGNRIPDVGFVYYSDETTTVVWGHADFLYERIDGNTKILRKGKIEVTVKGNIDACERSYEGRLTYIDTQLDLVVINVINCPVLIEADLAKPFPLEPQPYTCLDLHFGGIDRYWALDYTFRAVSDSQCDHYNHVDIENWIKPGIFIDSENKIIGMKTMWCSVHNHLAHVLMIDKIVDRLPAHSFGSDHRDIRFPPKDMNGQMLRRKAEIPSIFQFCFRQVHRFLFKPNSTFVTLRRGGGNED